MKTNSINLVTGSNGFLGSRIKSISKSKGEFLSIDREECHQILEDSTKHQNPSHKNVESLLHCAALNNNFKGTYEQFYKINVDLTLSLFNYAKKVKAKNFIFFSSLKCSTKIQQNDFYSRTKVIAEKKLIDKAEKSEVNLSIFRLPPIVSIHTNGNLRYFSKILKLNLPLVLPNDAKLNYRDIITINMITNLLSKIENGEILHGLYSACSKNTYSTFEIINMLKNESNSLSKIVCINSIFFEPIKFLASKLYESSFGNLRFSDTTKFKRLAIDD